MRRRAALAAVLSLALAMPAARAQETASFAQSFWRLVATQDGATAPRDLEIQLMDGELITRTPCFSVGQAFTVEPGRRFAVNNVFSSMSSTDGTCVADKPVFDAFLTRLGRTAALRRDARRLVLLDAAGREIATFESIIPQGLEHRWFRVAKFRAGAHLLPGSAANRPYPWLIFWGHHLEGSLVCGGTNGWYNFDGTILKAWAGTVLAGSCARPETNQALVNAIHDDLQDGPRIVTVTPGGHVLLSDAKGVLRMLLEPSP